MFASCLVALLLSEPAAPIDLIERLFGASNVAWVIGNGGMTVGLSALGEASVLSWPSPSYTDQLLHLGSNAPDARSRRNLAVDPAMGAFIGLRVRDGGERVVWPREDWTVTQAYGPAPVLVTTMTPPEGAGLPVVTLHDWVDPDHDAWVREVVVSGGTVEVVEVLGYWNLSPTVSRVPQLPLADWAMDAYNDYAALWDGAAVLHFRPAGRGDLAAITDLVLRPEIDFGPVGEALAQGPISKEGAAALLAQEGEAPGAWLAVGAREAVTGHQIGYDRTAICAHVDALADNVAALPTLYPGLVLPLEPGLVDVLRCDLEADGLAAAQGWANLPSSAWEDLADGRLEGAFGAAGQVDEALAVAPVEQDEARSVRFVVGAGATADLARASLEAGRTASRQAAVDRFQAEIGAARMPRTPALRAAAERALTNLLLAQDRKTGAIVASIARQPSYALDWPRDGAFFDYALDLAGLSGRATAHARFTMSTQRLEDATAEPLINGEPPPDPDAPDKRVFPAGGWEMNSYADGLVGGNIRWEIDNAALAVWSLVEHAERLPEAERSAFREEVAPVVTRAADLLARWRDPATGLHAPANEDDNAAYTQTLHGAATTWRALESAAAWAGRRGDEANRARWQARADELRGAIAAHLTDARGYYSEGLNEAQNPGNAAGGAIAWALWPAGLPLPESDTRDQLDDLLDLAEARLAPTSPGGAYVTKILLAAGMRGDALQRARAKVLLERFVASGAWLGETYVAVEGGFQPRVANPHVWAGTLVYLAAMALDEGEVASEGGGCTSGGASWAGLIALALGALARRRIRRPSS